MVIIIKVKKREKGRIFDSPAIQKANEYSRARQRKLKIVGEVIQDEK